MLKTAVVILNWNSKKFLIKFLPSLIKHTSSDADIYIADNGSTDDSIDFVKNNYPEIKLILLDKNYGFTGGYNRALEQISAEYFILLNSDIEVTSNWIKPSIELLDNDKKIAACMPKIRSYEKKEYFEYAGAAGGFIDKFGYPFCRGRILSNIEKDIGQYDDLIEIFWASGACMFIRADLFMKAGGFDDHFFAHMEEIDLCWKLKNMGYKIVFSPKSLVYHVGGGTLPNNSPRKLYFNFRNNLLLLYKNLPSKKLYQTIFIRLILDGIAGITYLSTFSFSFFIAVIKAHISFHSMLRIYHVKRKNTSRVNENHPEIIKKSILLNFFIKGKKTFNKL